MKLIFKIVAFVLTNRYNVSTDATLVEVLLWNMQVK